MHDSMTVAFEIKWPIPRTVTLASGHSWKDHYTLITIWHKDPESDGSDNSCGYSVPKLTNRERKIIDEVVKWEESFPYYSSPYLPVTQVDPKYDYSQQLAGDCLAHIAGAWQYIAWARDKRRNLTAGEWWRVVSLATHPHDNLRAILSDKEEDADDRVRRFFSFVMCHYLGYHRPWYKHPRFHLHHWQIQCHPVQNLKRWLFSRCAGCGKRFEWGYCPTSGWDSRGPLWFKSEPKVYHTECYGRAAYKKEAWNHGDATQV